MENMINKMIELAKAVEIADCDGDCEGCPLGKLSATIKKTDLCDCARALNSEIEYLEGL